jgi:hypothetical protein
MFYKVIISYKWNPRNFGSIFFMIVLIEETEAVRAYTVEDNRKCEVKENSNQHADNVETRGNTYW